MRGTSFAPVKIRVKRQKSNLLADGWQIALDNWRCIFWLYVLNLIFGLLSGIPLSAGLAPYLDHSLASRQIAGNLDAAYLGELALHLSRDHLFVGAGSGALGLSVIEFLAMILLVGGTIRIYLVGEPPRLPVLLARGSEYFWRMVRVSLLFALIAGLVLGGLIWARGALLARANEVYVERTMFLFSAASAAFVLLVALLLRLWFDLVEIYAIRNAGMGNRRIRQAVLPALRLLLRNFWWTFASFLLIGLLGAGALAACIFLWKDLVPPDQVWLAAPVAQLGLLLLLAARYWQRAMQVSLVLGAEFPLARSAKLEAAQSAAPAAQPLGDPAEPTLRDLVLKLQREPLAKPETIAPPNSALFPETSLWPWSRTGDSRPPQDSLLQEHQKKAPLPGGADADSVDSPDSTEPDSTLKEVNEEANKETAVETVEAIEAKDAKDAKEARPDSGVTDAGPAPPAEPPAPAPDKK
jgi:hypothetical protein